MSTTTTLQIPKRAPMVNQDRVIGPEWSRYFDLLNAQAATGANAAPADATYFLKTANGSLPNGLVATNSATVTLDYSTPGQVKWDAVNTGTVTHTAGNLTLNALILGNGGADIKAVAATDGQVPIGSSADGSVTLATLTAGTGIAITNAAASITIAATGGTDYVVMSDGANPPTPMDDGAGNFIYVGYTP